MYLATVSVLELELLTEAVLSLCLLPNITEGRRQIGVYTERSRLV